MNNFFSFTYKKTIFITSIILFIWGDISAQQKDFGIWTQVTLSYELNKKCNLGLSEELRIMENVSEIQTQNFEPFFTYKIIKNTTLGIAYRWSSKRRVDDSYFQRHRYITYLKYKLDFSKKWNSSIRLQFQNQYSDIGRSADWRQGAPMLRCKLQPSFQYNKKNSFSVSTELIYALQEPRPLSAVRYALSWDHEIKKNQKISLGYMLEQEYNKSNPYLSSVINIGYEIELNKYFKKKK